ncbi:VOC family protein [Nocardioides nanhaiensis]
MTTPARTVQITLDCPDPHALALFWAAALGYQLEPPPPGHASWEDALEAFGVPPERRNDRSAVVDPAGQGPRLFFQRSEGPVPSGRRVHLDVRAAPGLLDEERMAALEAECRRLQALGARLVERHEPSPPLERGHLVLSDPAGHVFCLD